MSYLGEVRLHLNVSLQTLTFNNNILHEVMTREQKDDDKFSKFSIRQIFNASSTYNLKKYTSKDMLQAAFVIRGVSIHGFEYLRTRNG